MLHRFSLRDWTLRLRALFLRKTAEHDLDDELGFHLEMEVRKNLARGMSDSEARRRARVELGASDALIKDQCRDQRRVNFIETMLQDIRYALRGFRRTPLFAFTVVATIALGLGINTAVFTVFNAYVLRPLSVRDPYSLFELDWLNRHGSFSPTSDQFEAIRNDNPALSEVFGVRHIELRMNGRMTYGELVSGNYFRSLGVNAILGRTLVPSDSSAPGREPVMVLSYAAWQDRFASDPEILGRKILIHGYPLEVVGVLPPAFSGVNEMSKDFWAPLSLVAQLDADRDVRLQVFGRLKPALAVAQADAALSAQAQSITAALPVDQRAERAELRLRARILPISPQAMFIMSPIIAAFALVLLIACANIANMMLARAMARQREIGIRLSLGAARARLIRQLLTESVLLALPSAAVGFAISQLMVDSGVRLMFATLPAEFSDYLRVVPLPPDFRVFAFMMIAALAAAVLFGLAPALQATRTSVVQAARGDFGNEYRPSRLRNSLVVVQVAGSALLLICTGVLLRGANRIHALETGIDTRQVVELEIQEKDRARIVSLLRSQPMAESVSAASSVPLSSQFHVDHGLAHVGSASPEFFEVFHIPILRGRNFTQNEALDHSHVAIVTSTVAHRLFPGGDAIGKPVHFSKSPDARIIGIARDIDFDLSDGEMERSFIFLPTNASSPGTSLMVRVNGDAEAARQQIDALLDKAAPGAVNEIHTMDAFVVGRQYPFRVAYWVSAVIGVLALLLALTGIYGVLSYLVIQRSKEIGIRLVMGASEQQVVGLVLRQSIRLAAIGLAVGAIVALAVSRIYVSAFDQAGMIDTFDTLAYLSAIACVFVACLVAGFIPSLRAARVDPASTLRYD